MIVAQWVQYRPGHGWNRGLVQHVIHTLACALHGLQMQQIGLAEINAVQDLREVLALAGSEVIYPTYLFSALQQSVRKG